jgi:hypothetical protein
MRHLNSRPWECRHCLCPASLARPGHRCLKPCGQKFKQKSHLGRHQRIHRSR